MVSNSSNNYVENFRIDFVYFGGNSITELSLLRTLVYDIPTDKLQVKQACVHQQNWWLTRYKLLIAIGGHRPKANSNAFILF